MRIKRWQLAKQDYSKIMELSEQLGLPTTVCKVINARYSHLSVDKIKETLGNGTKFESPLNLIDMEKAVDRILTAIENEEKIVIYGDYDCDGITSTALFILYFKSIGVDVDFYIPNRGEEGYGLNISAIDKFKKKGISLIITVDNGISSHKEIDYAGDLGIDVIVTDHHTPRSTIPNAVAVINPHRTDCPSKFKDYAGVGVAFQLVCALDESDPSELLPVYADLVAIGTVADLVVMRDENKVIVNAGVQRINENTRPGIKAILETAGITKEISSEEIAFGISPRINAAGRVGDVDKAVELLISGDIDKAREISESLSGFNTQRRGVEELVLQDIMQSIEKTPEILYERMLIIDGKDWHQGVLGIVASRLVERFGKPTIVFSESEGILKGSGRSLEGFSLIEAIDFCSENLTHFGGHTLAAGLTIEKKHLNKFKIDILNYAKNNYDQMPVLTYEIDCSLNIDELSISNIKNLDTLGPFGSGNVSPVFLVESAELSGIYPTADEKHMRLKFNKDGKEISTIFFRMSPERFPYKQGDILDMVVDIDVNEWNGNEQLSVKIKDLRPSGFPEEKSINSAQKYEAYRRGDTENYKKEDLMPSRKEQEIIYKFLRSSNKNPLNVLSLWEKLYNEVSQLAKLQIALDIFTESELIVENQGKYRILPQTKKVKIENTIIYKKLS